MTDLSPTNANPPASAQPKEKAEPSMLWMALEARAWRLADRLLDSGLAFDFSEERTERFGQPRNLIETLLHHADFETYRPNPLETEALALKLAKLGAPFLAPEEPPEGLSAMDRILRDTGGLSALGRAFNKGRWGLIDHWLSEKLADGPQMLASLLRDSPLHPENCLSKDNVEGLTRILAWGFDPNTQIHGSHLATFARSPEALAALAAAGANLPDAVDRGGRSLTEIVATVPEARKRAAMLSIALKAIKEAQGKAPKPLERQGVIMPGEEPAPIEQSAALDRAHESLSTVAKTSNRAALKRACALFGADPVNYRSPQGESLLGVALGAGNFDAARFLIESGAKILEKGVDGQPALMRALWAPLSSLALRASKTAKQRKAAPAKRLEFLKELPALCAAEGFSWSQRDALGRNWLVQALHSDSRSARERFIPSLGDDPIEGSVAQFLRHEGCDPNDLDVDGKTVLDAIVEAGLKDHFAHSFVNAGARFNRPDPDGVPMIVRLVASSDFSEYNRPPDLKAILERRPSMHSQTHSLAKALLRELMDAGPMPQRPPIAWPGRLRDGRSVGEATIGFLAERFDREVEARDAQRRIHGRSFSPQSMEGITFAHQIHELMALGLPALAHGESGAALWDAWAFWMFPEAPVSSDTPKSRLEQNGQSGKGHDVILTIAGAAGRDHFVWALGSLVCAGFSLKFFAPPDRPETRSSWSSDRHPRYVLAELLKANEVQSIESALFELPVDHPFFCSRDTRVVDVRNALAKESPSLFNQLENAALKRAVPDGTKVVVPKKTARL